MYLGYRNAFAGGTKYTSYYTRYYQAKDGDDAGSAFSLEFGGPLSDQFKATTDFDYSPTFEEASSLESA